MPAGLSNLILTSSPHSPLSRHMANRLSWSPTSWVPLLLAGYSPADPFSSFLAPFQRPLLRKTFHCLQAQRRPALIFPPLSVSFRAILPCVTLSLCGPLCAVHPSPQLKCSSRKSEISSVSFPHFLSRPQDRGTQTPQGARLP